MESPTTYKDYYIKRLDEINIEDLVFLFGACFGASVSRNELLQRHLNCHGENKFIGYLAYHSESQQPSAYYGVFPVNVLYKGEHILVGQSGDTMTHPNHQRQGLFVYLGKMTFELCREIKIKLVFGFPNVNSYPGFIKYLNFIEGDQLSTIRFLQNKLELFRLTSKNKLLHTLHKNYVRWLLTFFTGKGTSFQNSNSNNPNLIFPDHDEMYFKLKYDNYKTLAKIAGCNAWLKINSNAIVIGDIEFVNEHKLQKVIKVLKILTFFSGYRFLLMSLSDNAFLFSYLKYQRGARTSKSARTIFLDLDSDLPVNNFSFLESDVDVF